MMGSVQIFLPPPRHLPTFIDFMVNPKTTALTFVFKYTRTSKDRQYFKAAVKAVITDETFQVESEYTCAAVKTSQALQEWWLESENREQLSWFAHILIVRLQTCFCCKHSTNVALK